MILDTIVADKKLRLEEQKALITPEAMKGKALACGRAPAGFYQALSRSGLSIIGEFKKASPSMGIINNRLELADRIGRYNESVDAISCLTEEDHFNGSADYLREIRRLSPLPVIRKDFIIDEYQIYEARVIGADAVLLIAAIVSDGEMEQFYRLACDLGMDVLLEVHDEEEMDRAVRIGAKIIGINNRNLKDFSIDLNTTRRLSQYLDRRCGPARPVLVAESGVTDSSDISYLKQCGVDALLIGRAFMESEDPAALAREWKAVFDKNDLQ